MPPLIFSIEGNIGAGKSTFLSALENKLGHRQDVCFLQEPIEEWKLITDENSTTILERFYKDKIKFSFPFQIMAYITRLSNLKKAYENPQYKYIFTDRSLFTDKCVFTQMLYDDGEINEIEYKIYNRWFLEFIDFSNIENYNCFTRLLHFTSRCTIGGICEWRKSKPRAACRALLRTTS